MIRITRGRSFPDNPGSQQLLQAGHNMMVRGVRGATSVVENSREAILASTRELLSEMLRANQLDQAFDDIASIIFTTTPDLNAAFPAEAARGLGMTLVPLICASEINVPGKPGRIVRVLMHVNTTRSPQEIVHIYLGEAKALRPDMQSAQ